MPFNVWKKNEANDFNLETFDSHVYRSSKRICLSKPQVSVFFKSRDLKLLETQKRVISSLYNWRNSPLADGQSFLKRETKIKVERAPLVTNLHADSELSLYFVHSGTLSSVFVFSSSFFSVPTWWNFITPLSSLSFSLVLKIRYYIRWCGQSYRISPFTLCNAEK